MRPNEEFIVVTVKVTGHLIFLVKESQFSLEIPEGCSIFELGKILGSKFGPKMKQALFDDKGCLRFAAFVNGQQVDVDTELLTGNKVMFFVPMAGG